MLPCAHAQPEDRRFAWISDGYTDEFGGDAAKKAKVRFDLVLFILIFFNRSPWLNFLYEG